MPYCPNCSCYPWQTARSVGKTISSQIVGCVVTVSPEEIWRLRLETSAATSLARLMRIPALEAVLCDSIVWQYVNAFFLPRRRRIMLSSANPSRHECAQLSCSVQQQLCHIHQRGTEQNAVVLQCGPVSLAHPEEIAVARGRVLSIRFSFTRNSTVRTVKF